MENSRPAFKLLLSCPSGLSPAQVSVVFNESYDRIPHSDLRLENSIAEIWDQRVQRNTSLYNGTKFRYGGHILHGEGGYNRESCVCLHLGLTDYRTFVGTNLNPSWEQFLVPSEDSPYAKKPPQSNPLVLYPDVVSQAPQEVLEYESTCHKSFPKYSRLNDSIRCQHTSSPLGNGAIVETSDKKILVLQRSNNVGEFPGHFVFPGGHPEPQDAGIASHEYGKGFTDSELINKNVSQEMFDSIIKEIVEEIGVPAASLCNPVLIGISRRELNVRPTAFFYSKCSLQSKEIQQLYFSAQDGFESTQLYAVSMNDVERMTSKMPGCHQGGFALYKLMVENVKNI